MVRVRITVDDPANRLTIRELLKREGHEIVHEQPDVIVADDITRALSCAAEAPTVVLAAAEHVREAISAMRQGVYGYVNLPLIPGELQIMVQRAAQGQESAMGFTPRTLEDVEAEHILNTLRHCRNNRAKAARLLGIGRNTLWRKLARIQPDGSESK
ncbi:MAG: hypothetical protein AMXMBFR84_23770 [Candidatus Hydrogenedentota bacterium]